MNDIPTPPSLAVVETEAALIGAMMIDNRIIDSAIDRLQPEHFFDPVHRRVYKVMIHLRSNQERADPITIRPYFGPNAFQDAQGEPFAVGPYLARLTGSGAGLIGTVTFIDQVVQFATYRQMRSTLQEGINRIEAVAQPHRIEDEFEPPRPIDIASDTSAEMLKTVEVHQTSRLTSVSKLLGRVRERQARFAAGTSIGALCATICDINALITAAAPGTMTVIGGRPGMGKSVLAQSMAMGYAINGHPTLSISLEMSEDAQAMRQAADLTFAMNEPVSMRAITRAELSEAELLTIDEATRRVEVLPLTTVAPGRVTIEHIEAIVARHVAALKRADLKLEVLFIDYAQIVAGTGRLEGRERIEHISERVLEMAKRYQLAAFLLSQLGREVDKRPDKRPLPSDLKESGRLEEDADNVLLVFRPEYYLRREEPKKDDPKWEAWNIDYESSRGKVDIIADKVRMGEPGTKRAKFYGDHQAIRGSDFVLPDFADDNPLLKPVAGSMVRPYAGVDFDALARP